MLRAIIRWACTVRQPAGTWLLAENPLRGLSLPKETSPKWPVATHDRFLAVRGAIQTLATEAKTKWARAQWLRLELALVLVEATGRRIGAVRGLRSQDIASDPPAIT